MPLLGEKDKEKIPSYANYIIADRAKTMGTFEQRGQTCGIYALAAALKTYNISIPITETAKEPAHIGSKDPSMRYIAKHTRQNTTWLRFIKNKKITKIGELFHAKDVVTLAKQYGHVAEVKGVEISNFFLTISRAIKNDRLVMIPFSPDRNTGYPDPSGGTGNAHWCLTIGYFVTKPSPKILVTHWDRFFDFDAGDCQSSNANSKNFKQAYYYKQTTGGIKTYDDFNKILKAVNNNIRKDKIKYETREPYIKIENLKKYLDKKYPSHRVKKVVKIPEVNLSTTDPCKTNRYRIKLQYKKITQRSVS